MHKPKSIKNVESLVIASCLMQALVITKSIEAKLISNGIGMLAIFSATGLFFALPAYLALRKKSNLAKWILVISIVIGVLLNANTFKLMAVENPSAMPYEIISSCLELAILYYLFTSESKKWFAKGISVAPFPFSGSRDLNNDAYKIFLAKKYQIEKNDALEKIICDNKLFENIQSALIHADNCESQLTPKLIPVIEQKTIVLDSEARNPNPTHSEPIKVVTIQDSSENFIEKNMKPIMVFGTFFWILVAIFVFVH